MLPLGQDENMVGKFRIGGQEITLSSSEIKRVIRLDWIHSLPGLPKGIDGLVEVDGFYVPLVSPSQIVGEDTNLVSNGRCAVVALHEGEPFAFSIDDILALDEMCTTDEDTIALDCATIWQRVHVLNGKER